MYFFLWNGGGECFLDSGHILINFSGNNVLVLMSKNMNGVEIYESVHFEHVIKLVIFFCYKRSEDAFPFFVKESSLY